MAQLICKDLTVGYEGQAIAHGLTFCVEAGDYLCIVGENGSGKSTLLKTILGLTAPLAGRIERGDGLLPTEIGYLPQQTPQQRDFPASVEEVVLSGCLAHRGRRPFFTAEEKDRARGSMKRLGIDGLSRESYRTLSGGQQQRVLLARALCAAQKMLVLDEPVSGLDPRHAADLYSCIDELHREGVTIIMVSHDMAGALGQATHILHLAGEPLFFGTKEAYLKTSLGQAYATILIAGVRTEDAEVPGGSAAPASSPKGGASRV